MRIRNLSVILAVGGILYCTGPGVLGGRGGGCCGGWRVPLLVVKGRKGEEEDNVVAEKTRQ